MKKLTKASTGAVLVALGIVGANPAHAATFVFGGTSTQGPQSGQFNLANAALGTTTIPATSISNFSLIVGGQKLINSENPSSGSITFGLPFTGKLSDFNTVTGGLNFLSGTNFSLANNQAVSGTNPAVFGPTVITGTLTSFTSVPEPTSTLGLFLLGGIGAFSWLKKRK